MDITDIIDINMNINGIEGLDRIFLVYSLYLYQWILRTSSLYACFINGSALKDDFV